LVSDKVYLTREAEESLLKLSPSDKGRFAGVCVDLQDDHFREMAKIDLNLVEDGFRVWGVETGELFLTFVEDGDIVNVTHVSRRHPFRPLLDRH
jgi:hypothetical protein